MSIQNPPFRFLIYCLFAGLGTLILLWLGFLIPAIEQHTISFTLITFSLLLIAQYVTNYLMEEFIMELEGNQSSKWISAPLGVLFTFLTYSILSLSWGLLL